MAVLLRWSWALDIHSGCTFHGTRESLHSLYCHREGQLRATPPEVADTSSAWGEIIAKLRTTLSDSGSPARPNKAWSHRRRQHRARSSAQSGIVADAVRYSAVLTECSASCWWAAWLESAVSARIEGGGCEWAAADSVVATQMADWCHTRHCLSFAACTAPPLLIVRSGRLRHFAAQ